MEDKELSKIGYRSMTSGGKIRHRIIHSYGRSACSIENVHWEKRETGITGVTKDTISKNGM
jgi:hypothetical protein